MSPPSATLNPMKVDLKNALLKALEDGEDESEEEVVKGLEVGDLSDAPLEGEETPAC